MVNETIEHASSNRSLPIPKIPNFPNNIAAVSKPDKQEIIKKIKYLGLSKSVKIFYWRLFLVPIKEVHKHYLRCFNLSPHHCLKHSCYLTPDTQFGLPIMHMMG